MIMGIVADFVAGTGQYKSKKINILSYILFSLGGTGSYLVFFADPEGWAQTMLGNGTEQGYIDTMQATANIGILIAMFVAVLVTAAISALAGSRMLKKQFEKAGITA
jgi:energy-coupling factor transport system substrate-specific component